MFSYDASEGRWINRKLDTYKDGYREYPKYATFMPIEGSDAYMAGGHYTVLTKRVTNMILTRLLATDSVITLLTDVLIYRHVWITTVCLATPRSDRHVIGKPW